MTLKEFSDKYNVPYHIVYNASYKVHTVSNLQKDRDYDEADLFDATREQIRKRIEKHRKLLYASLRAEVNLNKGRCDE